MTVGPESRRRLTVECTRRLIDDFIGDKNQSCRPQQHPAQAIQTPGAVLSVWGAATGELDRFVPYFAQKPLNFDGEISSMKHRMGICSHRGLKPESPNQDDFFALSRADSLLFGVLDGHGLDGHDVSHWTQERLPTLIMERLRQAPDAWDESVATSIRDLCAQAKQELANKAECSGTTLTLVMLDQFGATYCSESDCGGISGNVPQPMRLRCAFLGDSIAAHAKRKDRSSSWEVASLVDIHRPDRVDEQARIEAAGGSVEPGADGCPARLVTPEWCLAVSRSFGDFSTVPFGLSSEPEFTAEVILEPDYEHLVLACSDGVWDVIPPAQAVKFVGKFRPEEAQLAVERLVSKAQRRWQETDEVVDDITAVLVWPGISGRNEIDNRANATCDTVVEFERNISGTSSLSVA